MEKLTESAVIERLSAFKGWSRVGDMIVKQWQFASPQRALEFVNALAAVAQRSDHYPEIVLNFRGVRVESATHSAGGVTELDFRLASEIDQIPVDR